MRWRPHICGFVAATALIPGIISPSPGSVLAGLAALSPQGRRHAEPIVSLYLAQNGDGPLPSRIRATAQPAGEGGAATSTAPAESPSPAKQYCTNIANAAADARFARQRKLLADLAQELDKRTAQLESKIAELRTWLARRDEFSKKAEATLVGIYARMKPDAAAAQLAEMDEETAAAVLTKLNLRASSAIMNEMQPAKAARLNAVIAGAAKGPENDEKAKADEKKS